MSPSPSSSPAVLTNEPEKQQFSWTSLGTLFSTYATWITLMLRQKCNVTTLICTVFACIILAWSLGPLITRSSLRPQSLFPNTKVLTDYPYGDLTKLSVKIVGHEASIVMYYSHWDLDCLRFKDGFQRVAKEFGKQVFFAAINCWYPDGECAKVLRMKRFPVILAHVRGVGDVEYRGPLVPSYLIPFVENILDPIVPINSAGDLLDLRAKHDGVLVRYYDFRGTTEGSEPKGYQSIIHASIKSLAIDPWRRIQFAVVTCRKVAQKLRITHQTSAYLFLWNATHEISLGEERILSENVVKWIYDSLAGRGGHLITWFTPSGQKSDLLASVSEVYGPILILFTPRNFLLRWSPYFELLREVAMDYLNCDNSSSVRSLIHRNILRRLLLEERILELEEFCNELTSKPKRTTQSFLVPENRNSCCSSKTYDWTPPARPTIGKKCNCTMCLQVDLSKFPSGGQEFDCESMMKRHFLPFTPNNHLANSSVSNLLFCNQIQHSFRPPYTPYYRIEYSCSGVVNKDVSPESLTPTSTRFWTTNSFPKSSGVSDDRIIKMMQLFEKGLCSKLHLALNYSQLIFPETSEKASSFQERKQDSISGLGCSATNASLKFIAIDSILFPSFATSIGVDIEEQVHSTAAIILDAKKESVYLLSSVDKEQALSKQLFYEFIRNFTTGSLTRFLRTEGGKVLSSEHCLSGSDGLTKICVPDVTTETFSDFVLDDPDTDVVLFYYTPWCGFCSSVSHIFLSVARFFSAIQGVRFGRINADRNHLSFTYTVDRFPTILLFPAKKKSDSVAYPSHMPITTTGLVQFVLANSQPKVRWQTSFELCSGLCLLHNLHTYSTETRLLNRKIKVTRNELNHLNRVIFWPKSFRHPKHESEQKSYQIYLLEKYRQLLRRRRSLYLLSHLLQLRIGRMISGVQTELTQNFFRDMLMLLHERTTPIKSLRKRKKNKKSKHEKRLSPDEF